MIHRQHRQIRIEQAIHRSTPEQLLIQAVLRQSSSRAMIERELERRAHGDVPLGVCGRIHGESTSGPSLAAA